MATYNFYLATENSAIADTKNLDKFFYSYLSDFSFVAADPNSEPTKYYGPAIGYLAGMQLT
jgi:hypothetical protein